MPKQYTIEELRLSPEQTAFAEEHVQLAYKLVSVWLRRYGGYGYDAVYDAAMKAYIKTVRTFDPEKGVFSSILYKSTEREMHKLVRDLNAAKRKGDVTSLDLKDSNEVSMHDKLGEPDKYVFEDIEWLRKASGGLTEREKRFIHFTIVEGLSQHEVAALEGITQMTVSRTVKKGLEKMRSYAEEVG